MNKFCFISYEKFNFKLKLMNNFFLYTRNPHGSEWGMNEWTKKLYSLFALKTHSGTNWMEKAEAIFFEINHNLNGISFSTQVFFVCVRRLSRIFIPSATRNEINVWHYQTFTQFSISKEFFRNFFIPSFFYFLLIAVRFCRLWNIFSYFNCCYHKSYHTYSSTAKSAEI